LGELLPQEGDFAGAFAIRGTGGAILQSKVYASAGPTRSSALLSRW